MFDTKAEKAAIGELSKMLLDIEHYRSLFTGIDDEHLQKKIQGRIWDYKKKLHELAVSNTNKDNVREYPLTAEKLS